MEIININNKKKIIKSLNNNKLLILPTDTIYGFVCKINNDICKKKIFYLKKRTYFMNLSLIVDSIKMVKKIIFLKRRDFFLLKNKKSITIINYAKPYFNKKFNISNNNKIAIRITKSKWLRNILKKVGPLYSTSVNITGDKYATNLEQLIKFEVDFIVYDGFLDNKPSKIYDISLKKFIR